MRTAATNIVAKTELASLLSLMSFSSGALEIGILLTSFSVETIIIAYKDFSYAWNAFGKSEMNIIREVERYASKALILSTITFAAISFLISQHKNFSNTISGPLLLFIFGFSLFLISYKLEIFAPTKRIIWDIQQRLFNYGILSLTYGVFLLFSDYGILFCILSGGAFMIVSLVHILEYIDDYRDFGNSNEYEQSELGEYI